MSSPLVIGGTGGSGTRVVARIVRLGGRFMGGERNESEDTMPFALFDLRWGLQYLESGPDEAMEERFDQVVADHVASGPEDMPWGWKAPRSYLFLPFLRARFPSLRFIHVVRDGRDMALSRNQRQARQYGHLLGRPDEAEPVRSAAWWEWANLRAKRLGEGLGAGYLALRFEDLREDPASAVARIVELSGGRDTARLVAEVQTGAPRTGWRECDRERMQDIESACAEGLSAFGYI